MSIWDNLKKFTRPYADEEYDDYEDEDELDDYEEEVAEPARSGRSGRRPNPFKLNNDVEEDSFDIEKELVRREARAAKFGIAFDRKATRQKNFK